MLDKMSIWKRASVICIAIIMIFSAFVPVTTYAADYSYEYGWQGAQGTIETDKGKKDPNNLLMLNPVGTDITVNKVPGSFFLNTIATPLDGTKRIDFLFSMSAGMNNLNIQSFKKNNMQHINIYKADDREYDGTWTDPIVSYNGGGGKLKLDEGNSYKNKVHGDGTTGQIDIYFAADTLKRGRYVLEFGKNVCGNNTEKILGYNVAFYFTVGGVPELPKFIAQIDEFLQTCEIGTDPGDYPQDAYDSFKAAVDAVRDMAKDETQKDQWEETANDLDENFTTFKNSRIINIESVKLENTAATMQVGATGKAQANVSAQPDEDQYKSVTWTASENITIDPLSGKYSIDYPKEASWIKAVSVSDPDVASSPWTFNAMGDGDTPTVNIPVGQTLSDVLQRAYPNKLSQMTNLKVIAKGNSTMQASDLKYIAENINALQVLDISETDLQEIPERTFSGNTFLQEVKFPERLSKIGYMAFYNCTALKEIELPAGLEYLELGCFTGCTALPSTVKSYAAAPPDMGLGNSPATEKNLDAFGGTNVKGFLTPYGCKTSYSRASGWRNFNISEEPSPVELTINLTENGGLEAAAGQLMEQKKIDSGKVDYLTIRTSGNTELTYNEDIPYLQEHFLGATNIDLSGCNIEDDRIKSNVFSDRLSLKKMRIPDDITTIGDSAFYNCKNLEDIILPRSLDKIGQTAFSKCKNLKMVVIDAATPPHYNGSIFAEELTAIAVPPKSASAYSAEWKQYRDKIIPQISIALNTSALTLEVAQSRTLTANVTVYSNNDKTVYWTSSNERVASVDRKSGVVRAIKPGTATITATTLEGGVTATCTVTVKAVAAPTARAASAGYNKTKVTWSGISGAAGYEVYRATKSNGSYSKLRTLSASSRSYTDTGRTTGTTYYYKIRAYKTINGTRYLGDYSPVVSAKPTLAKVTKVKARKGGSQKIKVTWKRTTGASGYTVYRSLKKNKSYKAVKTIKKAKTVKYTTGKLKKGKRYYFKVRAYRKVKGKKVYGAYSSSASYKAR